MHRKLGAVFINCPYDKDYEHFFRELVFLCCYFHYVPRFACEDSSATPRMDRIVELIQTTECGIHDVSRVSLSEFNLPRFNMPFELGMDVMHSIEINKSKKILVLGGSEGDYEKLLSDLKCADVEAHENESSKLFKIVRLFFLQMGSFKDVKSSASILNYYQMTFSSWLAENLKKCEIDMNSEMSMLEYRQKVCQFFDEGYGIPAKCVE